MEGWDFGREKPGHSMEWGSRSVERPRFSSLDSQGSQFGASVARRPNVRSQLSRYAFVATCAGFSEARGDSS